MTPYLLGLFVLILLFVVLLLVKTVRIIPQARAGIVERFGNGLGQGEGPTGRPSGGELNVA